MKKSKGLLKEEALLFLFFLIIIPLFLAQETVITGINISDSGPKLLRPIPNFSWAENTNLTNAFDLDDYFVEPNGENMSFSYSSVENVTVIINSENQVSFYPDYGFLGDRNITFNATDGSFNTSSNLVYLGIGTDTEPPQWSSPLKNKARVYQNDYINFTTVWTDNIELASYIFSIDQGSGFFNYSLTNFTGIRNTSFERVQISAAAGAIVSWMFCAYDINNNFNCTSVQTINISALPGYPSSPPSGGGGTSGDGTGGTGSESGFVSSFTRTKKTYNYTLEPESFYVSLKQKSIESRILRITNIGSSILFFNLSVEGAEDMVLLGENHFNISFGESKDLLVDFIASENASVDQYNSKIVVESSETREVPIVMDINAFETQYEVIVNVFEKYKLVDPGGVVKANITIKSLKDITSTELIFYVALKDFYGVVYDFSEEIIPFETDLILEKELVLPNEVKGGDYIFYARVVDEKKNIAIDSDLFEVSEGFQVLATLKSSFIFILIFFLSIFALFLMVVHGREKRKERILSLYLMLNELKKFVSKGELDKAADLYIRIKRAYGEPVARGTIQNREKLKEEIKKLSEKMKAEVKLVKKQEPEKKGTGKTDGDKKNTEKKGPEKQEPAKTDAKPTEKKQEPNSAEDNAQKQKKAPVKMAEKKQEAAGTNAKPTVSKEPAKISAKPSEKINKLAQDKEDISKKEKKSIDKKTKENKVEKDSDALKEVTDKKDNIKNKNVRKPNQEKNSKEIKGAVKIEDAQKK